MGITNQSLFSNAAESPKKIPNKKSEKVDKDKAKATLSKIFDDIFPDRMSYGQAQEITGTNKTNILRAHKGETLLNPRAIILIIKSGYKCKFVSDIQPYLMSCQDLISHLSNSYSEELWQSELNDNNITLRLQNCIYDNDAQILYFYLYGRESVDIAVVEAMFGKEKSNALIERFNASQLITIHTKYNLIKLNSDYITNNLEFRKNQMKISIGEISESSLRNSRASYNFDGIMTNKDLALKGLHMTIRHAKEQNDFIQEAESVAAWEKTELLTIGNYANIKTISNKEVVQ
ncbi:hypothetical protein [Halobacteriovorax sp. ZH2_bin.1]|uniref:hypothetical protein n=1 Tax=Halobacteriovorax sp. ZH2_bin.1 TaxID=3157724 RepID=UPI00371D138E